MPVSVVVEIAATEAARRDVFAIRHQVFAVEGGYLDPADYPDGLERDVHDGWAGTVSVLARVDGAPAGTIRLACDSPFGLEVARHADAETVALLERWRRDPACRVAEGSRFAVLRPFRGDPRIGPALLATAARVVIEAGVTHWVGSVNIGTHKGKNRLPAFTAFGFRAIGPAFAYPAFREEAVPVCLELSRARLAA